MVEPICDPAIVHLKHGMSCEPPNLPVSREAREGEDNLVLIPRERTRRVRQPVYERDAAPELLGKRAGGSNRATMSESANSTWA